MKDFMRIAFVMLMLTVSCTNQVIKFKSRRVKELCIIPLPRGFKKETFIGYHGEKITTYKYKSGASVYITDDKSGWLSEVKSAQYGTNIFNEVAVADSLDISGKYQNSYWREIKKSNLVIGYYGTDSTSKKLLDGVLDKAKYEHR